MATGVVLDRLVDILLVQVLRAWLASAPLAQPSWLGVLSDDVAGAAAARLHEDPSLPWTTAALARAAGVSRATLTRRFTAVTGESPGAYLTRWRMDLARAGYATPTTAWRPSRGPSATPRSTRSAAPSAACGPSRPGSTAPGPVHEVPR